MEDFKYVIIYRIAGEESEPARTMSCTSKQAKSISEAINRVEKFVEGHYKSVITSLHAEMIRNPRGGRRRVEK